MSLPNADELLETLIDDTDEDSRSPVTADVVASKGQVFIISLASGDEDE